MANNFCEKCGTRREGDARFCIKCGFRFEDDTQITAVQEFNDAEIAEAMQIVREEEVKEFTDTEYSLPVQTASQEPQVKEEAPIKTKKASYKGEVLLLMLSVICFIGSLGFYLATKTTLLDSIPFIAQIKNPESNTVTAEIPELTVEMAEEILNNATSFPYQYFKAKGMLNMNDYIVHPDFIEYAEYGDYNCYAVDGIVTKDDYFSYFEKYGTRDFIEKSLDQPYFYVEQNSKIYFSDNFGMGWYPYSTSSMCVEKIDSETYWVYFEENGNEGIILKYIDGSFKATNISPREAAEPYNEEGATIYLPDIVLTYGSTLDSVETELEKIGLKLDRNNIVYIKAYWGTDGEESYVTGFQKSYKKYKPGDSVGVIVAVEDPEYYTRGAKDGEKIPELTPEMAADILDIAAFLPMHIHFNEIGILNENEYINGDYGKYYSAEGMETVADVKNYYRQYVTEAYYIRLTSWYTVYNGKPYFLQYDVGDGGFAPDFMVIEKIDDFAYAVYDTRLMREFVLVYVDGAYKVTNMSVNGI